MNEIIDFFIEPYKSATTLNIILEFIAATFGVISVIFAKRENILVYPTGIISTGIYVYSFNNTEYNRTRDAFKRRRVGLEDEFFDINGDGEGPDFSLEALQDAQERAQRDRDLALLITIVMYALNIIDANVDAHLKQYNVNEDLAIDFKPYLDLNPLTNNPNYGMALVIKF